MTKSEAKANRTSASPRALGWFEPAMVYLSRCVNRPTIGIGLYKSANAA